jgi:5-methylcytosine-specific restriction endonuclease McrA
LKNEKKGKKMKKKKNYRRKKLIELEKEEGSSLQEVFRKGFSKYERMHKINKHVIESVEWIMNCRSSKLGGWKYQCECGKEVLMYKSCHNKSCPLCNVEENKEWLEYHKERLLEKKYLHIVFVLPEELNELFLKNKKEMSKVMFEVVKKVLKKRTIGLTGGIIMTEHTAGSTLILHPHIHCLVLLGGYEEKRKEFKEISEKEYEVEKLKKEFKEEYIKKYKKIEKELKRNLFNVINVEKLEFNVWQEKKYKNSLEAVLGYFSKGVRGGSISNRRILKVTEEIVKFAYKNKQSKENWENMELPIFEFIKRVLLHIPAKRQKQVRKTGIYASCKRKLLEEVKEKLEGKKIKLKTKKEKKGEKREDRERITVFCPNCKNKMKLIEEIEVDERYRKRKKTGEKQEEKVA